MKLDDDLRRATATLDQINVNPPPLDAARQRRRRRTSRLGTIAAAAIAIVVAATVAVGNRDEPQRITSTPPTTLGDREPAPTIVPFENTTTTTYVEPVMPSVPASARPCRNDDLEIEIGSPTRFPNSPIARHLQFTNVGTEACSLTGRPTVTTTGPDGQTVTATPVDLLPEIAGPVLDTDVIPPGTRSIAMLWLPESCTQNPTVTTIDVSVGDGPVPVVAGPSEPEAADAFRDGYVFGGGAAIPIACGLQVGSFTIAQVGRSSITPLDRLQFRLDAPTEAHAGQALTATFTVRNTTPHPVRLTPCSGYHGDVQQNAAGITFDDADIVRIVGTLPCDHLGSIQPNTRVEFQINIDIPADAPPGPASLWLYLDDISPSPVTRTRDFTILPA